MRYCAIGSDIPMQAHQRKGGIGKLLIAEYSANLFKTVIHPKAKPGPVFSNRRQARTVSILLL
jgi:hypothetical protein